MCDEIKKNIIISLESSTCTAGDGDFVASIVVTCHCNGANLLVDNTRAGKGLISSHNATDDAP